MDLSLVTLGKWQPFPEPQFSPLKMGRGASEPVFYKF